MKLVTILSLVCFLGLCVYGQQNASISGKILSRSVGLPGVRLVLEQMIVEAGKVPLRWETTTGSDGSFRFDDIPNGNYRLSWENVAGVRVESGSEEIRIRDHQNQTLGIELTGAVIRESVTVSVGQTQPVEQVSKTVDVIGGQEMRERADFALIETLRTIPGFRIQQSGGFGRLATVKTRGLRNSDTAVLIDGIRFRDATAITGDASPFISDFTLTSVSKIEVLRGSGSSLYGTNAIGGVIDFQTPRAASGTHGQIGGAFGGMGLGRFRGLVSHGWDKVGIGAGVSRTVYAKGIDGNDEAHNTNFQGRVDANPLTKTNLSGRFFFSDGDVQLNVSPDTLGTLPPSTATIIDAKPGVNFTPDANDPDNLQKSRFFSGQFVVNQAINDRVSIGGYYQGLSTRRSIDDGPLGPGFQSAFNTKYYGEIHTANAHVDWTPVSRNSLKAGYEHELEKFQNDGGTPNPADAFSTKARQRSNTFYVQDLVDLLDRNLQFAGGFRAQWFDLEQPTFSATPSPYAGFTLSSPPTAYTADGAVSYFIQKTGTKLRAHIGNGYHAPSMYERFGTFFFFGTFFQQGNPELKPERSIGYDAGVEQYFASEKVKASGTWFYTEIKDEITYAPFGVFGPAYFNVDKHFSRGAEFSISAKPKDCFDLFASYTFTNSDVRNHRQAALGLFVGTDHKAYGVPDHQFALTATQRYKNFWVNFDFLATSTYLAPVFSNATFNTYIYRFEGNRRGDLTAGYGFNFGQHKYGLRIHGTIENLFDNEYYENGFRTIGRTGRMGMTLAF